jgi:hypothetical protein
MVECICVDSSNRPAQVPPNKWLKKYNKYNIIFTTTVMPQKQLGVHLAEIDLDESCKPYEFFLASRFAFTPSELDKLKQLIKDCEDTEFSVEELMKQTELVED